MNRPFSGNPGEGQPQAHAGLGGGGARRCHRRRGLLRRGRPAPPGDAGRRRHRELRHHRRARRRTGRQPPGGGARPHLRRPHRAHRGGAAALGPPRSGCHHGHRRAQHGPAPAGPPGRREGRAPVADRGPRHPHGGRACGSYHRTGVRRRHSGGRRRHVRRPRGSRGHGVLDQGRVGQVGDRLQPGGPARTAQREARRARRRRPPVRATSR